MSNSIASSCELIFLALLFIGQLADFKPISRRFLNFDESTSDNIGNLNYENQVVHAQIGEYINISCRFDPHIIMYKKRFSQNDLLDNNEFSYGSYYKNRRLRRRRRSNNVIEEHNKDSMTNSRPEHTSSTSQVHDTRHNQHHMSHHGIRHHNKHRRHGHRNQTANKRHRRRHSSANSYIQFRVASDDVNGPSKEYHNSYMLNKDNSELNHNYEYDEYQSATSSNTISDVDAKYEIDWYFLDKHGRMNIISYGNQTKSKLKYKTFINAVKKSSSNNMSPSYSSSALYSQQRSGFYSPSAARSASMASSASAYSASSSNPKTYTHYLNAFIESEDDEGVYQCINPDWPEFIIRNITVLIGKNSASTSVEATMSLLRNMLFYLTISALTTTFTI